MRLDLVSLDWPEQDNGYTPDYVVIQGKQYKGERLVIDNHHFVGCTFDHCTFVYAGGPFAFGECDLFHTRLAVTGSAHRAVLLWAKLLEDPERYSGAF